MKKRFKVNDTITAVSGPQKGRSTTIVDVDPRGYTGYHCGNPIFIKNKDARGYNEGDKILEEEEQQEAVRLSKIKPRSDGWVDTELRDKMREVCGYYQGTMYEPGTFNQIYNRCRYDHDRKGLHTVGCDDIKYCPVHKDPRRRKK